MFTYCSNNPILFLDPDGLCRVVGPNLIKVIDCGEIDCKMSNNYVEGDYSKELAVLRGETNMYYGTPVVRTPVANVGFSFDVIYLGKIENIDIHAVYWLRHEYGHIQQQKQLGRLGYTVFVVVPSAVAFWKNNAGDLGIDYYDFPTEYIADQLSGVPRNNRSVEAQEYAIYYWDFVTSICEPLA